MSKFGCRCGHVMVSTSDDVPHEQSLFQFSALLDAVAFTAEEVAEERERMRALGAELTWKEAFHDFLWARLNAAARHALLCPNCGRLWLQRGAESGETRYDSYLREAAAGAADQDSDPQP